MNVGITGLCTPAAWTLGETLSKIREAGYVSYELALRDEGWFSLTSSDIQLREVAREAAAAGVDLVSLCPAFKSRPKDLITADAVVRRESLKTVEECLRIASVTGVKTVLLTLGALTPELYYDAAYANGLDSMRRLAPVAERFGVRLAIEYVWNKFLLSPMEFNAFLDAVGSSHVGFYFDPGNMAVFGYPEHWVRLCRRHVMAVHMKDFRRQGWQWTPLLSGDVCFPAVMRELRAAGFDGPLVSEVDGSIAPLNETAKAIREIMGMG
ncbi:MAG: sugar phosphate isomerase/epimerase [Spirochaetes bacterium]|nr:sugar phosphate isomerase/epimerase [Spirochaetota bacterium]